MVAYPLVFIGFYLGLAVYLGYAYARPPRTVPMTPVTLRDVQIPTADGLDPAWATPNLASGHSPSKVVYVLAHGYGGTRAGWRGIVEGIQKAGFEAVAPAMPG